MPPTVTAIPSPAPQASPTLPPPSLEVTELVSSGARTGEDPAKRILTAFWAGNDHIVYGFRTGVNRSPATQHVQWMQYDLNTRSEAPAASPVKYDDTFWSRNGLGAGLQYEDLDGWFSPSGKYVIYVTGGCSRTDENAKEEIWIAETLGSARYKVHETCQSIIGSNTWFDNETKVLLTASGESGAAGYYLVDVNSHTMTELNVISESADQVSPDGRTLALTPGYEGDLALYSFQTGELQYIDTTGWTWGPDAWSADGTLLYYWWGRRPGSIPDPIEIRVYNTQTGASSTVIDQASFVQGFQPYEADGIKVMRQYYLGSAFAVSPAGSQFLLWGRGLYLVTRR